jgi:hypothetical protein
MDATEREQLKRRLLQYPGTTPSSVEQELDAYDAREQRKQALIDRGSSNALAEVSLDKLGYSRPPGWRSVFFYPGSNRLRNRVTWLALVIASVVWFVLR